MTQLSNQLYKVPILSENLRLVLGVPAKDKLVISILLTYSCHCGMLLLSSIIMQGPILGSLRWEQHRNARVSVFSPKS